MSAKNINESKSVKIAVISDLHCHHSRHFVKDDTSNIMDDSYLITDLPRRPAGAHPVESLLETLVPNFEADYLLCPGDLTNKTDVQGFISGWDFVTEVAKALKVNKGNTIATLGNHDVDSRYNRYEDVFELARAIGKGFPIDDEKYCTDFWAHGFCFIEHDLVRILVFNSVFFHSNTKQSVKGRVDDLQLEKIKTYLGKQHDEKIQIALFHHHPIEHSRFNLGTEDIIDKGGHLIDILNENDFDLVIHGHKHNPWLRYSHNSSAESVPIFSSGSFAMKDSAIVSGSKNTFHIITIAKKTREKAKGTIITWEYLPNQGWRLAQSGDEFFPEITGFGYLGKINDLVALTRKIIDEGNGSFKDWDDFVVQVPEINNLTPEETIKYREELHKVSIITSPPLPRKPTLIGKTETG